MLEPLALSTLFVEMDTNRLNQIADALGNLLEAISSGIQVTGDAVAYALVWEFGNARQTKKGPKTVLGVNPNGEKVWLSIQAPRGWISINEPEMWDVVYDEISRIEFDSILDVTSDSIKQAITEAYNNMAKRCVEILRTTVPIDSGDLHDAIEAVEPGDELLEAAEDVAGNIIGGVLEIG